MAGFRSRATPERRAGGGDRRALLSSTIAAVAGVGFALFSFLSLAMLDPLRQATDQELIAWWSDGAMRRDSIISMYFMLLSAPFFLVFLAQLSHRLRSVEAVGANWSGLVLGSGISFVALLTVAGFSRGMIAQSIRFGDQPILSPDTLRFATQFSQAALGMGAVPFAAMAVGIASVVVVRTGVLARWVGWLGLVVAAGSFLAVAMMAGALGTPLLQLWVVAASFVLWRSRNAVASEVPAARSDSTFSRSISATR